MIPTMTRGVMLLAMMTGLSVQAQTTTTPALTIRAGASSTDSYTIGKSDCSLTLQVRWQYATNIGFICTSLRLWGTEGECSDKPGANDVRYDDVPALTVSGARADSFAVAIAELPGFKSGSTTPCGTDGIEKTHKICGSLEYAQTTCGFSTQPTLQASPLKVVYDTKAPGAPSITEANAIDQSITLGFATDSDSAYVQAEVRAAGEEAWVSGGEVVASTKVIRVSSLKNGTTYDVRLRARDAAGNVSEASDSVAATPFKTVGFWGAYRAAGGADPGGCTSAPGLVPVLLLLLPWRRRRSAR